MDFADDLVRGEAAGFAAHERDHTERAAVVAAVLDFEDRAGVVGFAALDGGGEEFGVGEDVAGQDLGRSRVWGSRCGKKKRIPHFARNDSLSLSDRPWRFCH